MAEQIDSTWDRALSDNEKRSPLSPRSPPVVVDRKLDETESSSSSIPKLPTFLAIAGNLGFILETAFVIDLLNHFGLDEKETLRAIRLKRKLPDSQLLKSFINSGRHNKRLISFLSEESLESHFDTNYIVLRTQIDESSIKPFSKKPANGWGVPTDRKRTDGVRVRTVVRYESSPTGDKAKSSRKTGTRRASSKEPFSRCLWVTKGRWHTLMLYSPNTSNSKEPKKKDSDPLSFLSHPLEPVQSKLGSISESGFVVELLLHLKVGDKEVLEGLPICWRKPSVDLAQLANSKQSKKLLIDLLSTESLKTHFHTDYILLRLKIVDSEAKAKALGEKPVDSWGLKKSEEMKGLTVRRLTRYEPTYSCRTDSRTAQRGSKTGTYRVSSTKPYSHCRWVTNGQWHILFFYSPSTINTQSVPTEDLHSSPSSSDESEENEESSTSEPEIQGKDTSDDDDDQHEPDGPSAGSNSEHVAAPSQATTSSQRKRDGHQRNERNQDTKRHRRRMDIVYEFLGCVPEHLAGSVEGRCMSLVIRAVDEKPHLMLVVGSQDDAIAKLTSTWRSSDMEIGNPLGTDIPTAPPPDGHRWMRVMAAVSCSVLVRVVNGETVQVGKIGQYQLRPCSGNIASQSGLFEAMHEMAVGFGIASQSMSTDGVEMGELALQPRVSQGSDSVVSPTQSSFVPSERLVLATVHPSFFQNSVHDDDHSRALIEAFERQIYCSVRSFSTLPSFDLSDLLQEMAASFAFKKFHFGVRQIVASNQQFPGSDGFSFSRNPKKTDLVQFSHLGRTLLSVAASAGKAELVLLFCRIAKLRKNQAAIDAQNPDHSTPMHAAAENGHARVIEIPVQFGSASIDRIDHFGRTPLYLAASKGHVSAIEMLVRLGSRAIDTPDRDSHALFSGTDHKNQTPLYAAASSGHVSVIETLVRLGSNAIDTPDNNRFTPLMTAATNGHISVIELLVRLGSNTIDTRDHIGCTLIYAAAEKANVPVIEALVRLGSEAIDTPNNDGCTPLYAAASNGHVSAIETLVRLGSNAIDTPNNDGSTPMHRAASKAHLPVIETLVRLGSKAIDTPDNDGCTPLYSAAYKGHVSVIELLVRLGSKAIDTPNNDGGTPMRAATYNGHASVIETLVRLGSNAIDTPNNDGCTPLYAAASNGHVSVIETLVRLGSNAIDTPDNDGRTPMFVAAWYGHALVIETLVRLGSNAIDTPDHIGWTPLLVAAARGQANVIETLVRLGSKAIDTPDNSGCTPMYAAAVNGHASEIETLVRLGSNAIDTPNHAGCTPLLSGVLNGHVHVVEMLARMGSDAIDIPNNEGLTATEAAGSMGSALRKVVNRFFEIRTHAVQTNCRSESTNSPPTTTLDTRESFGTPMHFTNFFGSFVRFRRRDLDVSKNSLPDPLDLIELDRWHEREFQDAGIALLNEVQQFVLTQEVKDRVLALHQQLIDSASAFELRPFAFEHFCTRRQELLAQLQVESASLEWLSAEIDSLRSTSELSRLQSLLNLARIIEILSILKLQDQADLTTHEKDLISLGYALPATVEATRKLISFLRYSVETTDDLVTKQRLSNEKTDYFAAKQRLSNVLLILQKVEEIQRRLESATQVF